LETNLTFNRFKSLAQVYDGVPSPVVTVATVANGVGPSVSPSLWAHHAHHHHPHQGYNTGPGGGGGGGGGGGPGVVAPSPYHPQQGGDYLTSIAPAGGPGNAGQIYAGVPVQAPPGPPPPQYLGDPSTLLNYPPGGTPYTTMAPPQYHPHHPGHPQQMGGGGYPGYPGGVVPQGPPPEVYHGGVTYYSPQTQIQRQPMMTVTKRPKSVLQLVEPPEKNQQQKNVHFQQQQQQQHHQLEQQMDNLDLHSEDNSPQQESWSAQMDEMSSPTDTAPPEIKHHHHHHQQPKISFHRTLKQQSSNNSNSSAASSKSPPLGTTTGDKE